MTVQRVTVPHMPVDMPLRTPLVMQVVVAAVMNPPVMDPAVQTVPVPVVAVDPMRVPMMPTVMLQVMPVGIVPLLPQVIMPPMTVRVTVPMMLMPARMVLPMRHMVDVRSMRDVTLMPYARVMTDVSTGPHGRHMAAQMRATAAPAAHGPAVHLPLDAQHRPPLELTANAPLRRLPDSHG